MELDQAERIYYKQYELEYQIEGKRDNVKKADRLRLNLYFDPVRRSQELIDLDIVLRDQKAALQEILRDGTPLDDDATIKRIYRFFDLVYQILRSVVVASYCARQSAAPQHNLK